jgi:hypothetical protein
LPTKQYSVGMPTAARPFETRINDIVLHANMNITNDDGDMAATVITKRFVPTFQNTACLLTYKFGART